MDSADSDPIRQALRDQGALVGKHDQVLRDVVGTLQELKNNISLINTQLSQFSPQMVPPAAPVPQSYTVSPSVHTAAPPTSREPFVTPPEQYAGDLGSRNRFLLQCSLVFDMQPNSYPTDHSRIAYMINLLRGKAGQWATALWESRSGVLDSYGLFCAELRKVFDHPVQGQEASKRLLSLRQGSSSVATYSVDFRILSAESGWEEVALRGVFVQGLSEELKDELATRDEPDSLEELISLAIKIDNRLRERARERSRRPKTLATPTPSPRPSLQSFPSPVLNSQRPVSAPPVVEEEPMQLGRARLTATERQRRMEMKLCIYCGQAGHFVTSCPQTPKDPAHQ